ncbi:hypothetical protein [Salipiger marinus]|uniref:Uncharacterized protein n=1 Tax=Salipiger marinus TaxID=555512 RepID=A0A1G8U8I2_9RHOB|nr:hypothetical protein [Salipiger marinus]SDJ50047.1 hypothetical protein SAMN04487993_103721 [Salipiger marinus]
MKNTEYHRMDWNGIELEITYHPWLHDMARISVESPVPLPIAPEGTYRHALSTAIIEAAGGPVAYIDVMLEIADGA